MGNQPQKMSQNWNYPLELSGQTNFLLVKTTLFGAARHLRATCTPLLEPHGAPMGPNRAPWGPMGPN